MLTGMEMKNCFVFTKCSQAIIVGWVSLARCQKVLSHCALCKERLKDVHSHPGQWKVELQQFLLRYRLYSAVPLPVCIYIPII